MNECLRLMFFALLLALYSVPNLAAIDAEIEETEVGFDKLVKELSKTASQKDIQRNRSIKTDPLSQLTLHSSFAFANSISQLEVDSESKSRFAEGFQLGMGIDLLSKNWIAEGLFRNFGRTNHGSEKLYLREFDLRLVFRKELNSQIYFRLIQGLGARYIKYIDESKAQRFNQSTPIANFGLGFDLQAAREMSVGIEFSGRQALLNNTIDRQALDMLMRLDFYL